MRGALRGLSTVLIMSGLLLIADAGVTLAWEEPVTALLGRLKQDSLENDLSSLERTQPTYPVETIASHPVEITVDGDIFSLTE